MFIVSLLLYARLFIEWSSSYIAHFRIRFRNIGVDHCKDWREVILYDFASINDNFLFLKNSANQKIVFL